MNIGKEWKVVYQDVPFAYTNPHVLIVGGRNRGRRPRDGVGPLTRRGHGDAMRIRSVTEYTAKPKGRVVTEEK